MYGQQTGIFRVGGSAKGKLVIKPNTERVTTPASLSIQDGIGGEVLIDFEKASTLAALGATTIADSTAVDVAGIVADFNALLAALRTAGVIA